MMDGGSPPEFGSVGEYLLKRPGCNSSFKWLRVTTRSKQLIQSLASARQYYVNTVTAFNQAQYRLYTSLGQSLSNQK